MATRAAEPPAGMNGRPPDVPAPETAWVARLRDVGLRYGKTVALDAVSLDVPSGGMVGMIRPDGVGKSSLLSLTPSPGR